MTEDEIKHLRDVFNKDPGGQLDGIRAIIAEVERRYDLTRKPLRPPEVGADVIIEDDERRWRGRVTAVNTEFAVVDTTRDGTMYPFVADDHRRYVPGLRTTSITLELQGEA